MDSINRIRTSPMTGAQIIAVSICLVINFLDGFDVLAIAFAAPEMAQEWSVGAKKLGIIFSAGLAGMVFGAIILSPFADRIGRRPLVLICLCIISAGMLISAVTTTVPQLLAARLLTGLGVGGMLASLPPWWPNTAAIRGANSQSVFCNPDIRWAQLSPESHRPTFCSDLAGGPFSSKADCSHC